MSKYFSPMPGGLEITSWYANNETVLQEISFSVPYDEWTEFEESQLYQDIKAYVDSIGQRIPDRHTGIHELQYIEETEASTENSNQEDCALSFSALVRKLFHYKKRTR